MSEGGQNQTPWSVCDWRAVRDADEFHVTSQTEFTEVEFVCFAERGLAEPVRWPQQIGFDHASLTLILPDGEDSPRGRVDERFRSTFEAIPFVGMKRCHTLADSQMLDRHQTIRRPDRRSRGEAVAARNGTTFVALPWRAWVLRQAFTFRRRRGGNRTCAWRRTPCGNTTGRIAAADESFDLVDDFANDVLEEIVNLLLDRADQFPQTFDKIEAGHQLGDRPADDAEQRGERRFQAVGQLRGGGCFGLRRTAFLGKPEHRLQHATDDSADFLAAVDQAADDSPRRLNRRRHATRRGRFRQEPGEPGEQVLNQVADLRGGCSHQGTRQIGKLGNVAEEGFQVIPQVAAAHHGLNNIDDPIQIFAVEFGSATPCDREDVLCRDAKDVADQSHDGVNVDALTFFQRVHDGTDIDIDAQHFL